MIVGSHLPQRNTSSLLQNKACVRAQPQTTSLLIADINLTIRTLDTELYQQVVQEITGAVTHKR